MNADKSAGARTRHLRARTLAGYHAKNPLGREGGKLQNVDSSIITVRREGAEAYTTPRIGAPNLTENGCCEKPKNTVVVIPCPSQITNFVISNFISPPNDPAYSSWNFEYDISWDPIMNSSAVVTADSMADPIVVVYPTNNSAILYTNYYNPNFNVYLTITPNNCSPISTSGVASPCFLAGSLVTLADESTIPIEDVKVGMALLGAFGEINIVKALHRPLLGKNTMTKINSEHSTSSHHPHISADKQFYAAKPSVVDNNTYGKYHTVIDKDGNQIEAFLDGLRPGRTQLLKTGIVLKTVDGSRVVQTVEQYELPPETQLYNLVMSGSHTYHVDGYAVTGWPSEKDFDYDTWSPK